MNKSSLVACCALATVLAAVTDLTADDAAGYPASEKAQLPAALAALDPSVYEILSDDEAAQVRGQWLLTLDLPLIATVIEGQGKFDLNLLTVSGGVFAGYPVVVRIRVGDRDRLIQYPRTATGLR